MDWVKERLLIPASEWKALLDAIHRDHNLESDEILSPIADKLVRITPPDAFSPLIAALEMMPRVRALYDDIDAVECESPGFQKPCSVSILKIRTPMPPRLMTIKS